MAIHPSAEIHPSSEIAEGVRIGPWTVIGPNVQIQSGCDIGPHVVIYSNTQLGKNNKISPFAVIGGAPQDSHDDGSDSFLEVGNNNHFREFCTIHRGTQKGGGVTRIGNSNLFMAYSHIGHDCQIGHENIFVNNATLAGHVTVGDFVNISGFAGIHQHCSIGDFSLIAHGAIILRDVLPYLIISGKGPEAKPKGINKVGLKRHEFPQESIDAISKAYKIIFRKKLKLSEALVELKKLAEIHTAISPLIKSIENNKRGIVR